MMHGRSNIHKIHSSVFDSSTRINKLTYDLLNEALTTSAERYDAKRRSRKEVVQVWFGSVACRLAVWTEGSKILCLGVETGLNL